MNKFISQIIIIVLAISFTNCSTNSSQKISISEFNNRIIKAYKIDRIVVENNEGENSKKVFLYSGTQQKSFFIDSVSQQTINFIVSSIKAYQQTSISVSHISRTSISDQLNDYLLQLMQIGLIALYILLLVIYLVNLLKSKFEEPIDRLVWTIIIIFLPLIGILMYRFIGKSTKVKK